MFLDLLLNSIFFPVFSTYYKYPKKYYIPENCYWHISGKKTFCDFFLRQSLTLYTPFELIGNIISCVGLFSIFMVLTFAPPRPFHAYLLWFQNKAFCLKHVEEDLAYKIRWRSPGHFQTRAKSVTYIYINSYTHTNTY